MSLNVDWATWDFHLLAWANHPLAQNNSSLSSMLNDEYMFKDEAGDGEAIHSVIMYRTQFNAIAEEKIGSIKIPSLFFHVAT